MALRPAIALAAVVAAVAAAPARAIVQPPAAPVPVAGNPADRLTALPIEPFRYDPATRCTPTPRRGMTLLVDWMRRHAAGSAWGTYRCEKWGEDSASLHAEGRALDWHLDAASGRDRAEARRLILLLLAPDRLGNAQALARRMGVQELIWDCGYWSSGMTRFKPYAACYDRRGRRLRRVGPTQAHRDHVHIGLTRAGAAARTSFWASGAGAR